MRKIRRQSLRIRQIASKMRYRRLSLAPKILEFDKISDQKVTIFELVGFEEWKSNSITFRGKNQICPPTLMAGNQFEVMIALNSNLGLIGDDRIMKHLMGFDTLGLFLEENVSNKLIFLYKELFKPAKKKKLQFLTHFTLAMLINGVLVLSKL